MPRYRQPEGLPGIRVRQRSIALGLCFALIGGGATLSFALPASSQQALPAKAVEKPADALARSVHHQIQVLPFYSVFDSIDFRIQGGRVTLTGQVLRPTLKADAETAIKDLEGVIVVVNQIEVLPASPTDDELRRDIYRSIFEDNTLKRYAAEAVPSIHILVKDGNAALEGFVDSESDKKLAGTRASEVPNEKSFQNRLAVK